MRRVVEIMLIVVVVAAACGGVDTPPTTTPSPQTTSDSVPSTTTAPDAEPEIVPWDPAVADELVALEESNEGQWTVDTALAAIRTMRPVLVEGVGEMPPINVTRLASFVAENFDQVPADQWEAITATGPKVNGALVGYQTEEERRSYQRVAEAATEDFARLTGHRLNLPIYVVLSDLPAFRDMYAGTWGTAADPDAIRWMFGSDEFFDPAAAGIREVVATEGAACVIVLGSTLRGWPEQMQKAGVFHEVVHCHQNVVHPGGPAGFNASPVGWMDEGYASWAGEEFYGGTPVSRPYWNGYLRGGLGTRHADGFNLFGSNYEAIAFYSMLADAGIDPWGEFVRWFNGLRANRVGNLERYAGMAGVGSQEVVAGWTASSSRNDEFGAPWNTADGPGIQFTSQQRSPERARAGAEPRPFTAEAGEQRYVAVQFNTDVSEPSLITVSAEGLGTYRWDAEGWEDQFVVTDAFEQSWCVGEDCVCDDGTSPAPGAVTAPIESGDRPVLHSALFGGDNQARLVASVETLEDACEEEEDDGPLDACLFGTWNPEPSQFQDLLLTQYRSLPISDLTLDGTIDLTFTDAGAFTFTYAGVRGSGVVEGERYDVLLGGGSFGSWEATGGFVTLNFAGSDISLSIPAIGEGAAPSIPPGTTSTGYRCSGSALIVEAPPALGPQWPFPRDWAKAR